MKMYSRGLERMSEHRFGVLLLSPAFLLILVLVAYPIVYSLYLSFSDLVLSRSPVPRFVGLRNYAEMLRNPIFLASLWKTGFFSVSFLLATTIFGMLVALLLNNNFWGKNLVITSLLIPWAIPKVVNGLIWKWIYDGNYGILNAILVKLGIIGEYRFFFGGSPLSAILLISIANAWKLMPFVALMILAALQTIPKTLYEAAKVDGAGALQRFFKITVPQLKYSLIIIFILQTTAAVKVFDIIAVLTQGGPGDTTMVTYYYVYRVAFDYLNIGLASAGAYLVTAVIVVFAIVYYKTLGGGTE